MRQNIGSWIRAKWGRFCLLLFAIGMAIAIITPTTYTERPTSQFFAFFGQREKAAKGVIKEAPPKIRLVLDKGETLEFDLKNVGAAVTPDIKIVSSGKDLIVDGVNFAMPEQKMQQLWDESPSVRSFDGGIEVECPLDMGAAFVSRIYEVKNNVIIRHYYRQASPWGPLLLMLDLIFTPVIYVIGKVVIMILNRREQRGAKG